MPDPALAEVRRVMALTAGGTALDAYRAIEALAAQAFGPSLFTVNQVLHATQEVERLYSSDPAQYAVGGRKQKRGTEWGERVLLHGELFVAQGADLIRRHFDDHDRILGLGIQEIVNVPVLFAGTVVATMNLSRPQIRFSEDERPGLALLAGLLLPLALGAAR